MTSSELKTKKSSISLFFSSLIIILTGLIGCIIDYKTSLNLPLLFSGIGLLLISLYTYTYKKYKLIGVAGAIICGSGILGMFILHQSLVSRLVSLVIVFMVAIVYFFKRQYKWEKKKIGILLIVLILIMSTILLIISPIIEKSHEKNLIYEIALSKGNKSVKTQQIQMQVGDNWISTNIEGESYDVEISDRKIKSDFEDPELLLILPNILKSPEEGHEEELGVNPVKIEGKHTSAEYTSNYELNGTRKCKLLGYKLVENSLGEFNCSNIRCNTSYSLNMIIEVENGTVHTTTNGTVLSRDLVDEDKQLLIHSQHEISKVVKADFSDLYQKFGFEKMYREMPREQHVEINLIGLE